MAAVDTSGVDTDALERLTTLIAWKYGCDRGTFTVCWAEAEKGLECQCKSDARLILESKAAGEPSGQTQ